MPRGRSRPGARKPHSVKQAARRVLTLDEQWAEMVRERVVADAHPFQRAAIGDPSRFITLLVGRGGGKTTTMRARAIIKLTSTRRGRLVFLATTKDQAEELIWQALKDSVEYYGLTDEFTFNDTKLRCTCIRTGATLRLVGMDKRREVEKLRGQPFDEVYVDEAATHDAKLLANLLDRIVGPRLGERMGCIVMGGTPGHILSGPFYDATRPSSKLHRPYADRNKPEYKDWDNWSSHAWSLKAVADLPDAAKKYVALVNLWLEALRVKSRNLWSDENPIWMREYLGLWAADDTDMVFKYRPNKDGKPWNQWDPFGDHPLEGLLALKASIGMLKERFSELKDWRFIVAGDAGTSDPWACNVFAFSPQDPLREFWHVMPFEKVALYARPFAELLLGPEEVAAVLANRATGTYGGVFGLTGWPDGCVLDADLTTISELTNVYGIAFVKADREANSKMGAIELTNGDLVDGRIKIIKGSPLEQQLQQLQWAEDIHGRLKENKAQANHSTDTLVYGRKLVATLFESGAVVQESSGARTTYVDPQGLDPVHVGQSDPSESSESFETDDTFSDPWGG